MYRAVASLILVSFALACLAQAATSDADSCDSGNCQDSLSVIKDIDNLIHDQQAADHLGLLQKSAKVVSSKGMVKDEKAEMKAMTTSKPPLAEFCCAFVIIIAAIAALIPAFMSRHTQAEAKPTTKSMWIMVAMFQFLMIVGFYLLGKPTTQYYAEPAQNVQLYNYLVGVALMMFVGFGYLMTFNHWYGLGAVGFTMLITCLGVQWAVLVEPVFAKGFMPFSINLMSLLEGNFAVAAVLISFGGIIGKVDPSQLVVLTFLETIFYCANKQLLLVKWLNIADCGGTIIIHMFGAFFGLTVALNLGAPDKLIREKNCATSDIFAFIGTVFLWLYWPSFVAGGLVPGSLQAETAITNTILALLGSTVATFAFSAFFNGKMLRPVDIQNAALAGGVSIGAVANLNIGPMAALFIGGLAGELSTIGYCKIQGALNDAIGLHDTCGIHNLHGMPSVLGGLASVFVPLFVEQGNLGALGKPLNQLGGVVVTILVAILTGTMTAAVMKTFKDNGEALNDSMYWEVAEDFDEKHAEPLARRNTMG